MASAEGSDKGDGRRDDEHAVQGERSRAGTTTLRPLADKQLEVAQMSDTQAAAYGTGTKDAFQLVEGAGHFPLAPGEPGASHAAMQGVSSIVNVV